MPKLEASKGLKDLQVAKTGYLVRVTNEQLEAWPFTIPSPEERAANRAAAAVENAKLKAGLEAQLAQAHPALQPVIALHKPEGYSGGWKCEGCDAGTYAEDSADWPCSTIDLILDGLGEPVPGCDSHWMDGRNEVRCWAGTAGHVGPCR